MAYQRKIIRFAEIWYTTADLEFNDSHVTKYDNLKNSRWRTVVILKIVFGHRPNSAADCPISMKFCAGKQFVTEFGIGTFHFNVLGRRAPSLNMSKGPRLICDATVFTADYAHSEDYAVARCLSVHPSVCLSVCPPHAGILSKRLNISSNLFIVE